MAMQEGSPVRAPSAQVVGNAFVEQYYHILHQSPHLVHRFYQDSSHLSRPDMYGNMTTVTTMQVCLLEAINEKVLSLNCEDYIAEIKTADAQDSFEKGVIVLVTGCLTGKDNVRKKFTQTFFLAPQDNGYFVLNDVFRYIEEKEMQNPVAVNCDSEQASISALTPEPEPTHDHFEEDPLNYAEEEDINNGAEVCDPSDKEEGSVIEEEVVEPQGIASKNESVAAVDSAPVVLKDAPKKSYASIVKVMKSKTASTPVYVPVNNVRVAPADQQSTVSAKPDPTPEAAVPNSDNAPESSNDIEEAEGHSIYVRNLPYNAMPAQLEEAFKKFGPIMRNGIQVRSNKGFTFGFVEFETASSVQSALEASPITIGDHQAVVEEKRTNTRVGSSGRPRYSSGKGTYRSDSFRARGNFGGGRGGGYGRNEFRNQGEFSGRPRGSGGRNGDNYQRANQNERGGHQGGAKA
ncbi:ras GTPase-activating protein-binding protein 2-like isoform X2 [Durio zibethinus]|uniref:Ras GTPase-activating protein-binding protein 2-like isoform X2 n=1 Tax=Durio zibethinus TaxID=66656 RepID=A0A6P6AWW2_DURZI|nr:ras GTPase-activating protein-binding protein 2-like isoform X2 [Durio zibethinus]